MGIKDKVVILGMGCTKFGERWEADAYDLIVEAFQEAIQDAGIDKKQINAAWLGTCCEDVNVGKSSLPLSVPLRLDYIPVSRVENFCATGTEAARAASYAVASGACDIALALGVEKLKDTGYGGLPAVDARSGYMISMMNPNMTPPGAFAQLASAYCAKYGISKTDLKKAIGMISVKSHANGAKNPKAHLQKAVTLEQVLAQPIIADPLGLFDCCGVSDGAACVIVTRPEIAKALGKKDLVSFKAFQIAASSGVEAAHKSWDGASFSTTRAASKRAYEEAGIKNPREEINMIECHDCFSITELVTMEDLWISPPGGAVKDTFDGFYNADGKIPCQIDGGLKCFGHPIGASGIRMMYEAYLQMLGRAGARQLKNVNHALTHNLGGMPFQNVNAISIMGRYEGK
jgi:acetyl-CoA C-acetyltransferase